MSAKSIPHNLIRIMGLRGIDKEEMALWLRMSVATFYRRLKTPEEFTVGELMTIAKHCKIDFGKLFSDEI